MLRRCCVGGGYGDVVECDEEEDGSRNVNITTPWLILRAPTARAIWYTCYQDSSA